MARDKSHYRAKFGTHDVASPRSRIMCRRGQQAAALALLAVVLLTFAQAAADRAPVKALAGNGKELPRHSTALAADDPVARGAYLARAGLCIACHTDFKNKGAELAGGYAIEVPFGVIYSTNITPDPDTGIGGWSDEEFLRAMRRGIGRGGEHLFPAFPYTSFTGMTDEDVLALKAYLSTVKPVRKENRAPELTTPFGWRFLVAGWKWRYFEEGAWQPDPARSAQWNRGSYLVNAVVHCGECHTPRDWAGGLDRERFMAGAADGPAGETAPNITPHEQTGVGDWSVEDMVELLKSSYKPDGDNVQGLMERVIVHGYEHLSDEDLTAIAVYLRSLPGVDNAVD